MVKVESIVDNENGGCNTTCEFNGKGIDIANEVLCIIESVMKHLKEESEVLHMFAIQAIAENPFVLTGENNEDFIIDIENVRVREGVN